MRTGPTVERVCGRRPEAVLAFVAPVAVTFVVVLFTGPGPG